MDQKPWGLKYIPTMSTTDKKAKAVQSMFSSIAGKYDFLNHFLSLGIDITWRKKSASRFENLSGKHILDVACGTGDLSIAVLAVGDKTTRITAGDFSEGMLKIGREKIRKQNLENRITFEFLDALSIEHPDDTFDGVTCAFGIRNFADLEKGLSEMTRVLKPGGRMVILEFTTPTNNFMAFLYRIYFTKILPLLGGFVSGNRLAYEYLPDTVYKFPTPDKLAAKLVSAGLKDIEHIPLTFGICGIHTGVMN